MSKLPGLSWLRSDPADVVIAANLSPLELLRTVAGPAWMEQAACRNTPTEVFFPPRGQSAQPALQICGRCPVLDDCRRWILSTEPSGAEPSGIYGGMTANARRAHRSAAGARARGAST